MIELVLYYLYYHTLDNITVLSSQVIQNQILHFVVY